MVAGISPALIGLFIMSKKYPALSEHPEFHSSTPKGVALRRGCSTPTIYKEIREGRLIAKRLGRRTLITVEDERRWLDSLPDARESLLCEAVQ